MKQLFRMDGSLYRFMTILYKLLILNFTFIISAIPLLTIGSAITAMYCASFKLFNNQNDNVWKIYWHSFKKNFKPATIIWLIYISIAFVLFVSINMTVKNGLMILSIPFVIASSILILMLPFIFSLIIKTKLNVKQLFLFAFLISMKNVAYAIVLFILTLSILVIIQPFPNILLTLWSMLCFSTVIFFQTLIIKHIYIRNSVGEWNE